MKAEDFPIVMRQGVGFVLLTFSLLAVPKAISAVCMIFVVTSMGFSRETDIEKYRSTLQAQYLSNAVANLATFVVLLFLARWLFRGPRFLENWINARKCDADETEKNDTPTT